MSQEIKPLVEFTIGGRKYGICDVWEEWLADPTERVIEMREFYDRRWNLLTHPESSTTLWMERIPVGFMDSSSNAYGDKYPTDPDGLADYILEAANRTIVEIWEWHQTKDNPIATPPPVVNPDDPKWKQVLDHVRNFSVSYENGVPVLKR